MLRLTDDILEENDIESSIPKLQIRYSGIQFAKVSPREVGLDHDLWRNNQASATQKAADHITNGNTQTQIFELPTGSGKSGIATALAEIEPVWVFVHTHSLLDQYKAKYKFKILKGLASYLCVLEKKVEMWKQKSGEHPTAAQCHYQKMGDCPVADKCPYLVAREEALISRRSASTYAFGMLSRKVFERQGIGIWDEAHSAAEIITGLSEVVLNQKFVRQFALPDFPYQLVKSVLEKKHVSKLVDWTQACIKILKNKPSNLFFDESAEYAAALQRVQRLSQVINTQDQYYFEINPRGHEYTTYRGKQPFKAYEPQLLLKPLQAKSGVPKLVGYRNHLILMSATIGNPDPLATELGIENSYVSHQYPHPVPVKARPVYDAKFSRMTYDSIKRNPHIFTQQARVIASWILSLPPEWRGIILTASYEKRDKLREAFKDTRIADRIMKNPPEMGVTGRVNSFINDDTPGLIAVDIFQGWGTGVSLDGDTGRFAVISSVPFGNFTSSYEEIRRQNVPSGEAFSWWSAYTAVPQAAGRVSRGEMDPNSDTGFLLNPALLADGSATTSGAYAQYSPWFRESICQL